jgi:hypothetical protein
MKIRTNMSHALPLVLTDIYGQSNICLGNTILVEKQAFLLFHLLFRNPEPAGRVSG